MSLIQFESHYYFFAAGTFLILFFVVRFAEKFHHGQPEPGSFYSTRDEPIANRFIFAYGLVSVPYVSLLMIVGVVTAFLFLFGIQELVLAIVVYFEGESFSFIYFDFENVVMFITPWQFHGYSGYEIFGFALAGYRIGFYSEEKRRKAYYNSILVYLIYFSIFIWGIVGLESNQSQSVFYWVKYETEEILLLLALDFIAILLMTWFGNSRSIAVEEGDDVSTLPSVKGYMRMLYTITLIVTFVFLITSSVLILLLEGNFNLPIDEYILFASFFALILLIFIYAIVSILRGDISRIIILLDENDMLIEDKENQNIKNPKFLSILAILLGVISITSLYFLPLS